MTFASTHEAELLNEVKSSIKHHKVYEGELSIYVPLLLQKPVSDQKPQKSL